MPTARRLSLLLAASLAASAAQAQEGGDTAVSCVYDESSGACIDLITGMAVTDPQALMPMVEEPALEEPAPVFEEPAPVIEEPVFEEPAPMAEKPVFEEPGPVFEEPAPMLEEPIIEETAPIFEEPAPAVEEPLLEEPAPVTDEPVLEEPAPVVEAPTTEGAEPTMEEAPAAGTEPSITPTEPAASPVEEAMPEVPVDVVEQAQTDPVVQESVATMEQANAAETPPSLEADAGQVLGTVERQITETTRAADGFAGAVSANPTSDSAAAALARERERRARLEGVGLGALAGLVIGALIDDRQQVVEVAPERVIVLDRTTNVYQVWRDEDVLLRSPGTRETIETRRDGSTRTTLELRDGTRITTLRDATGRTVWRERIRAGRSVVIIDEYRPIAPIDVRVLPRPQVQVIRIPRTIDPVFGAELVRAAHTPVDRAFSLGQIRNVWEVRRLVPTLATEPVLFATGSAALGPRQAATLTGVAGVMQEMLRTNPGEVFLVEGHTDAVGSAASNLALSDLRAESVARALVEYFQIPAENLVFQGYGESLLAVPTAGDEARNRRVEIRRVTPLLDPTTR